MKSTISMSLYLLLTGVIGMVVGGMQLLIPVFFFKFADGVTLGTDLNLFNEIRASGGGLMVMGAMIIAGLFYKNWRYPATVIASVLYLSYGVSRVFSLVSDGKPGADLIHVMLVELLLGFMGLLALANRRGASGIETGPVHGNGEKTVD